VCERVCRFRGLQFEFYVKVCVLTTSRHVQTVWRHVRVAHFDMVALARIHPRLRVGQQHRLVTVGVCADLHRFHCLVNDVRSPELFGMGLVGLVERSPVSIPVILITDVQRTPRLPNVRALPFTPVDELLFVAVDSERVLH
jgi:hypothetical protein